MYKQLPHPDILCFRAFDMRDHFPEPVETFEKHATTLDVPLEWMLFGDVARLNEDELHLLEDYRDNPQANKDALRTIARWRA